MPETQIPVPMAQHDPTPWYAIRTARWIDILAVVAPTVPPGLLPTMSETALADVIESQLRSSELLQQLLEVVHTLSGDRGRSILIDGCERRGVEIPNAADADGLPETPEEFLCRVWLLGRSDERIRLAISDACVAVDALPDKRYEVYIGKAARTATWSAERERIVIDKTATFLREQCRISGYVSCRAMPGGDELILKVARSQGARVILHTTATGLRVLRVEPAVFDIIKYVHANGRLLVAVTSVPLRRHYVSLLGEVLFKDKTYFHADTMLNLQVVLDADRLARSARRDPRIHSATLTSVTVQQGGLTARLTDRRQLARWLRERALNATTCVVLQARIVLVFTIDGELHRFTINLALPRDVSKNAASPLDAYAERFLWEVGIYELPPQRAETDWWCAPEWEMPEAAWRQYLRGVAIEPLLALGILVREHLGMLPRHTTGDMLHEVLDTPQGEPLILPLVDGVMPAIATVTDRLGLRWDAPGQARRLSDALGTTGCGTVHANLGAIDIGYRSLDSHVFQAFLLTSEADAERLRLVGDVAARHDRSAVVIIPSGRPAPVVAGVAVVARRLPDATGDDLIGDVIVALGWQTRVSGVHVMPRDGKLAMTLAADPARHRVWWQGREISSALTTPSRRLLAYLAQAWRHGGTRTKEQTAAALECTPQQIYQTISRLRKELDDTGVDGHALVQNQREDGYFLSEQPYGVSNQLEGA